MALRKKPPTTLLLTDMSSLYGYIYCMLISEGLSGMPLYGGALYMIGRVTTVFAQTFSPEEAIYLPKALPLTELPDERMQFTLGFYGEGDFFTMKGVIEEFLEHIGMKKKAEYDPNAQKPWLHPGRQANVVYEGTVIGYLGEVHPKVMANYGIGQRTYVAVLDMPAVDGFASFDRKYEGIAKYPAVTRDISMVVPRTVLVGQIEKILAQRGGKILESYSLFDIYEGTQIKEGYKSIAYTLTFRAKDKNLEEADLSGAMNRIVKALEAMKIELRA